MQPRALAYLDSVKEDILSFDEHFQLAVLELIRRVCHSAAQTGRKRTSPQQVLLPPAALMAKYAKLVHTLCSNTSGATTDAVSFDAATTLVTLTAAPTAVRATVNAYCQLLLSQSDNNVKLVILGRLTKLRHRNEKILQDMLMNILRSLSSPNLEIRRQTLALAMSLLSPRNVLDVVNLLTKELQATDQELQKELQQTLPGRSSFRGPPLDSPTLAYRKLLMDSLHHSAVNFPEVTLPVLETLMDYIDDPHEVLSLEVIHFVREVVHQFPGLRSKILRKLVGNLGTIQVPSVLRVALWIISEYANTPVNIAGSLKEIYRLVGPLPLVQTEQESAEEGEETEAEEKEETAETEKSKPKIRQPKVLADGTYAMPGYEEEVRSSVSVLSFCFHSSHPFRQNRIDGGYPL